MIRECQHYAVERCGSFPQAGIMCIVLGEIEKAENEMP